MITNTLDGIFDDIVEKMCNSIELWAHCDSTSFSFSYEDHGYLIEGSGQVGGDWHEDGDGFWTPREHYLKNGWGYINDLAIIHYNEKTDEETEFSDDVFNDIFCRLDKEMSIYMKNY